jgi:hypothetical protein
MECKWNAPGLRGQLRSGARSTYHRGLEAASYADRKAMEEMIKTVGKESLIAAEVLLNSITK